MGKKLGEELALTLAGSIAAVNCASAHSVLGKLAGLDENQIVSALRGDATETKVAAALKFANTLVEKRGQISDVDFQAVTKAGFTAGEVD